MIGILAGMGPKSTGPFVDKVVEQCQMIYGATYDMDFPHMMVYSCPTPFYFDRPVCHEEMEQAIIAGAQKLESTGAAFIAMPCNTAHLYFANVQHSLSIPLLNMVAETLKEIPAHAKKVALLATNATVEAGIYQDALAKQAIEPVHHAAWQDTVNQLITAIKLGQIDDAVKLWSSLSLELADSVDAAIIACTDLNVVLDKAAHPVHLVDSSACLARATVNRYLSLATKND
ncbi:aspartate/glutamate racemase family protein [Brevibacillus fluminis]|uniref:aspartate/glutamate racemase family protein n=1 Tax=Brevibacillus fluminis TaxID=511487 RepID=UPI003F8AF173